MDLVVWDMEARVVRAGRPEKIGATIGIGGPCASARPAPFGGLRLSARRAEHDPVQAQHDQHGEQRGENHVGEVVAPIGHAQH